MIKFLILLITFPAILALFITDIPKFDQASLDGTEKIYSARKVSQAFKSPDNNLSIIGVSIKNPNLKNKEDLYLYIFDGERMVRDVKINGVSIGDGAFIKFKFAALSDSKDKLYTLEFASPTSTKEQPFEVLYTKNINTNLGDFKIIEEKDTTMVSLHDGQIALVLYFKVSDKVGLAREIYSSWMSRFLSDSLFALSYLGLTVGLIIALVFLNFKESSK